jgi:signal transduction histidine kinase
MNLEQTQAKLIHAEKLRALSDLAGGVAHDFNNLLTAILGRAQVVLTRLPSLSEAEIRRYVGVIERAALDGAETVRRLQQFTRSAPRSTAQTLVVNSLIEAAGRAAMGHTAAASAEIELQLELGSVPPVAVHAAELREVLVNLATNAIEAMPGGGRLTLRSRVQDCEVAIEVADTGVGIERGAQRRMFEPFFTTKGPGRSGLGLSVAFGIVNRYGGEIVVDTEMGRGTTVRILLPAVRLSPADGPRQASRSARTDGPADQEDVDAVA